MNVKEKAIKMAKKKERIVWFAMIALAISASAFAPNYDFAIAQGAELDSGTIEVIAIVGAALGGIVRTVIPYLRKKKDREEAIERGDKNPDGTPLQPLSFSRTFATTFVIGIIGSIAAALILLPQTVSQIPTGSTVVMALSYAFTFAYTTNDVLNEIAAT